MHIHTHIYIYAAIDRDDESIILRMFWGLHGTIQQLIEMTLAFTKRS